MLFSASFLWDFLFNYNNNCPGLFLQSLKRSSASMLIRIPMPWHQMNWWACSGPIGSQRIMQDGRFWKPLIICPLIKEKWNRDDETNIYCRVASWTEWKILYVLCKDSRGLLHKDTIRAVYDGSLFERMEKERIEKSASKKNE